MNLNILISPVRNATRTIAFLCLVIFCFSRAHAQDSNPHLYKEVQLSKKVYTLHALTREVQKQTGFNFSFNASRINPNRKIRFKADRLTVQGILDIIRKQSGIAYKTIGQNHIIYTEAPAPKNKPKIKEKNKKIPDDLPDDGKKEQAELARIIPKDTNRIQQIMIIGDSSAAAFYFSGGSGYGGAYPGSNKTKYPFVINYDKGYWEDPYAQLDGNFFNSGRYHESGFISFIKRNTIVDIGLSVDELYYFNPQVRFGFRFLYGTLSYHVGNYSHWRYGLGMSSYLNEQWSIHLNVNTGPTVSASFTATTIDTIPGPIDTFGVPGPPTLVERNTPFDVQSRLTKINFFVARDITPSISLGAGLTFNYLNTKYLSNGLPISLNDILLPGIDIERTYRTINPPYRLSSTYNADMSENIKMWIGVYITFNYRFPLFKRD